MQQQQQEEQYYQQQQQNPYTAPMRPHMSEQDLAFLDEVQAAGQLIIAYHDGKEQETLAMCESLQLEVVQVYSVARFLIVKWPQRTDIGSLTYEYAILDILRRSQIVRYLEPNSPVAGKRASGYEENDPFRAKIDENP